MMSSRKLSLSSEHLEEMQRHVEDCYPEEGCGILGGFADRVAWVIPITNMLHSSTRFQMDPREQIDAFFKIEDAGGKLIGIYHSHPNGPEFPSESDVRESAIPEAVHIIWHHLDEEWNYQAYRIDPVVGFVAVGISLHRP
jgi:proteasome lid subunit RPN8/RPN11